MTENTYNVTVKPKEKSVVEITAEIPAEEFESHRENAMRDLAKDMTVPGFRKGHVPEKILIEKIGESRVLYEMAERALRKAYPAIVSESKTDAIGEPKISITKIAKGNPLGFTAETAVLPEVKLPDYKKIAEKKNGADKEEFSVSDEDMKNAINRIKASIAMEEAQKGEGPAATGEGFPKDKDGNPILPDLTDEKVKELGYKDMENFNEKLREGLLAEKKRASKEKVRLEIAEDIIKESTIDLPEILVDSEIVKMFHQFETDIQRMGMKPVEYLKNSGKTEEDLRKEWKPDAEKRVKLELILSEIAKKESLHPSEEEIEKETSHMMEHYPNAEKNRVRAYVTNLLSKEKVFEFLENKASA